MQEDETLWIQISKGDSAAFTKLYSAQFSRVRNFLRVYLGTASVVEDVAQETFLQFWKRPGGFQPDRSSLKAYLFGIARKKAADWWRHHGRASSSSSQTVSKSTKSTVLIGDALEQLDPDLRNVLWLREVEGYSYDELASILDVPLGTVKSRLFAAREKLRRIWNPGE